MKKFLHTRVLPILLCFTLSFGIISYETPKAEAVISETAVLTGVVCAYLSSVGISLAMDFASSGAIVTQLCAAAFSIRALVDP